MAAAHSQYPEAASAETRQPPYHFGTEGPWLNWSSAFDAEAAGSTGWLHCRTLFISMNNLPHARPDPLVLQLMRERRVRRLRRVLCRVT